MSNSMNWAEMDTDEIQRHIKEACQEMATRKVPAGWLHDAFFKDDASMPENPLKNPLGLDVDRLEIDPHPLPNTRMVSLDRAREMANEATLVCGAWGGDPDLPIGSRFQQKLVDTIAWEAQTIYNLIYEEIRQACKRDGYYADSNPNDRALMLAQESQMKAQAAAGFLKDEGHERLKDIVNDIGIYLAV